MEKKSTLEVDSKKRKEEMETEPGPSKNSTSSNPAPLNSSSACSSDNIRVKLISDFNPIEKALEIPMILDEIFKLLKNKDRKNFREVNRLWWQETEAIWRKDSWMRLYNKPYGRNSKWESTESFYKLFSKTDPDADGECRWKEEKYGLLKHPVRRFLIDEHILRTFTEEDPESTRFFWGFYGTHITHLKIHCYQFGWTTVGPLNDLIREILLKKCPNLIEFGLAILDDDPLPGFSSKASVEESLLKKEERQVAEKLKKLTLNLDCFYSTCFYIDLLRLVPNLVEVAVFDLDIMNELAEQQIQVQKVLVFDRCESAAEPLLNYVKTFPTTLKELTYRTDYGPFRRHVGSPYSPLHGAVLYSQSLSVLKLSYRQQEGIGTAWLTDLRGIFLPNLKELYIKFCEENENPRFDFVTLKGLPNLEIFNICYFGKLPTDSMTHRHIGTDDWICAAPKFVFEYPGFPNVEGEPWNGNPNLRELIFDGWQLIPEDMFGFFREYFPNLEYFGAALNRDTLPLVCTSWENTMQKVCYTSRGEDFSVEFLEHCKLQYEKIQFFRSTWVPFNNTDEEGITICSGCDMQQTLPCKVSLGTSF